MERPSACAYLGVRTYPAFAMFSNLAIEGGRTNHWIALHVLPKALTWTAPDADVDVSTLGNYYGAHVGIVVLDTDVDALKTAQVNLAPLLPTHAKEALRRAGADLDFHITPPPGSWPYGPTEETFRPFALPLAEARRRVAGVVGGRSPGDCFVTYRWVAGGRVVGATKTMKVAGGKARGGDEVLARPLPRWRALLHRYRSFSLDESPCRH